MCSLANKCMLNIYTTLRNLCLMKFHLLDNSLSTLYRTTCDKTIPF